MKRISRSAIVEHSAAELYALVQDIEAYPEFLPWCLAAQVRERSPHRTVATLTVGLRGLKQSFTTENVDREAESIDMKLLEGPFRRFAAHWRFRPLGRDATKLEFSLGYEFASRIIARALDPLFEQIAASMVDAFTRRAQRLLDDEIDG
jgi:ribosome-associated toxin RatA of RatAB toxin-antitoxin module